MKINYIRSLPSFIIQSKKVFIIKRFLLILILALSFHSLSKADDITDFEIEGISIGDSLLDYFSETEINNSKPVYYPSSKKFFQLNFWNTNDDKTYEFLTFLVKASDKKYYIYEMAGYVDYKRNVQDCYKQEKKIINEIKSILNFVDFKDYGKQKKNIDKTGKSTTTISQFYFADGGIIKVSCDDWSLEWENKGEIDGISVSVASKEAFDWFVDEAYK
tara:strand:- start:1418 stop:2071 length:654 start_codon:yes stop_codon:yes gene_type:complete